MGKTYVSLYLYHALSLLSYPKGFKTILSAQYEAMNIISNIVFIVNPSLAMNNSPSYRSQHYSRGRSCSNGTKVKMFQLYLHIYISRKKDSKMLTLLFAIQVSLRIVRLGLWLNRSSKRYINNFFLSETRRRLPITFSMYLTPIVQEQSTSRNLFVPSVWLVEEPWTTSWSGPFSFTTLMGMGR